MDNPWDLEVIIRLRNSWCLYSSIAVLWLVARYSNLQWYGYNRFVRWLVEAPLGSAPDRIAMFIVITNVIGTIIYDSCVVRAIPTHSQLHNSSLSPTHSQQFTVIFYLLQKYWESCWEWTTFTFIISWKVTPTDLSNNELVWKYKYNTCTYKCTYKYKG